MSWFIEARGYSSKRLCVDEARIRGLSSDSRVPKARGARATVVRGVWQLCARDMRVVLLVG
eukprot:134019-Lingulodinium_polyedra.AAC.1